MLSGVKLFLNAKFKSFGAQQSPVPVGGRRFLQICFSGRFFPSKQ